MFNLTRYTITHTTHLVQMCDNFKNYVVDTVHERIKHDTYLITMAEDNFDIKIIKCEFSNSPEMKDVCKKVYVEFEGRRKGYSCQNCHKYICLGCGLLKFTNIEICVDCYIKKESNSFKNMVCKICEENLSFFYAEGTDIRSLFCLNCKILYSLNKYNDE